MIFRFACICGAVVGATALAPFASATVLTFEQDLGNGSTTLAVADLDTYGDRVVAIAEGNFRYGDSFGFTPNVVVDYLSLSQGSSVSTWGSGYGNLEHVIWGAGPSTGENTVGVRFTADDGYLVNLHGLDIADWSTQPRGFFRVLDGDGGLLFEYNGVFNTETRDSFNFAQPLSSSVLTLEWSQGWHTAVDNVAFSQAEAVPEPATLGALAIGALALLRRRAKR